MADGVAKPRVLIIDDDDDFARDLEAVLAKGHEVAIALDGTDGLARVSRWRPDVILLDIDLGGEPDGYAILRDLRGGGDAPPVIMLTGEKRVGAVVRAIKEGAFHYVTKPPDSSELRNLIELALGESVLQRRVAALQDEVVHLRGDGLIAVDERSLGLLKDVDRVAPTDATVFITGECGTGKEMIARRIHEMSARSAAPFVGVNCAAVPSELIESEFFGHERGAFTGADRRRAGKFELAAGGTLFLDEIGDAPEMLQVKLLRVLEERVFFRVGGESPLRADVRVVAATSKDPEREVEAGRFREELFYRLNVVRVHLPPLHERPGDILPMAHAFLTRSMAQYGREFGGFTSEAESALLEHDWPGNIRELRNLVERAAVLSRNTRVGVADLFAVAVSGAADPPPYDEARERALGDFKLRYLATQLRRVGGNVTEAAERSGLIRQSFQRMVRDCGLDPEEFRD